MMSFEKDNLSSKSALVLEYVYLADSYQACIGNNRNSFLSLRIDGVHKKIERPLLKLQKSLYWRLPREKEFNNTSKLILKWSNGESDRILEIPEADILLLVNYTKKIIKETKYIHDLYSASISWGETDPSIDYFKGIKCLITSRPEESDKFELMDKDLSLKDSLLLNIVPAVGLPINRILSTEKLVRNNYLSWTAKDLSTIAASKDVCKSATKIVRDFSDKSLLDEYYSHSKALCESVNSNEITQIAESYNNFYEVTKGILLESGETKVKRNSTYAKLFKDYQNSIKDRFKTIRNLQIDMINLKRSLFKIYKIAYYEDKNTSFTLALSNSINEIMTARAKEKHNYYFPDFKLLSWRKEKNVNLEELPFIESRKSQFSSTLKKANCILENKLEYLSLRWTNNKSLNSFLFSFQKIEKAKNNLIYNSKTISQKKLKAAEKKLIRMLDKQEAIATKFLLYSKKTGNTEYERALKRLLSCI